LTATCVHKSDNTVLEDKDKTVLEQHAARSVKIADKAKETYYRGKRDLL
jgi:hypothetical protein